MQVFESILLSVEWLEPDSTKRFCHNRVAQGNSRGTFAKYRL